MPVTLPWFSPTGVTGNWKNELVAHVIIMQLGQTHCCVLEVIEICRYVQSGVKSHIFNAHAWTLSKLNLVWPCMNFWYGEDSTVDTHVQWNLVNLKYLAARLCGLDRCAFYLTPMVLHRLKGGATRQKCHNFDHPEEAEMQRLFAPTMDNMTGKEMSLPIWYIITCC